MKTSTMLDPRAQQLIDSISLFPAAGHVFAVASSHIDADGPLATIGSYCCIYSIDGGKCIAEVTAISQDRLTLVPLDQVNAIKPGDKIEVCQMDASIIVGEEFAGRAIDGLGRPLDGGPSIIGTSWAKNDAKVPTLDRLTPDEVLVTGIRAVDGLLTIGVGQRIGIFAAAGVGKTRLVDQIARQTSCDHVVICQVGERGREVEEFWSARSTFASDAKLTLVAATSDDSAPLRVRAVEQALALSEYWRASGRNVLLVIDSITRLAMALREIGLVSGEPPTVRAYTPNVLKALPQLVERCGRNRAGGAITGIFTVLTETDDTDDPITEIMKSLLDGHIILSRKLAQLRHFPAIDLPKSISRLSTKLATNKQAFGADVISKAMATYDDSRIFIESGLYVGGTDADIDRAIASRPLISEYLRQSSDEAMPYETTISQLVQLSEALFGG